MQEIQQWNECYRFIQPICEPVRIQIRSKNGIGAFFLGWSMQWLSMAGGYTVTMSIQIYRWSNFFERLSPRSSGCMVKSGVMEIRQTNDLIRFFIKRSVEFRINFMRDTGKTYMYIVYLKNDFFLPTCDIDFLIFLTQVNK